MAFAGMPAAFGPPPPARGRTLRVVEECGHVCGMRRFPGLGRLVFLNENLGGHATMHLHLFRALAEHPEVDALRLDVPSPGLVRRALGVQVPGLARLDADLSPLRSQVVQSIAADRLLRLALADGSPAGAIHAYSQHAVLCSVRELRRYPSVVSTDGTAFQNAEQLPYRHPTRFTGRAVALAERFERRVFQAATLVVAQSEWAAASILERFGLDCDRVRVIPFGMMPPERLEPRERREPLQVTFTGTTLGRKGGRQLVRVFRERLRDRATLNLVTRDDVNDEPGVRVLRDLQPGDPRLAALLAETAVFALPSEIDKSPYSILEAMFAGVPVVSTRVGGIPEMVVDGVTGLLVEPGDDEALGDAIEHLLDSEADRERMGAAGRARALERFDARLTTESLLAVIEEAEARHRP